MSALPEAQWVTVADIAKFLECSKDTVYKLIDDGAFGELRKRRPGQKYAIARERVLVYAKNTRGFVA